MAGQIYNLWEGLGKHETAVVIILANGEGIEEMQGPQVK
jgi:hypothetical protein